jgi:predicted nucleic acid-binding protein
MITAVDTNVLLDVLRPNPDFVDASRRALAEHAAMGSLILCPVVYAELCAHFPNRGECDRFLRERDIRLRAFTRPACDLAARAWKRYRDAGGPRERIMPNFLIGGHTSTQANRLLSRDRAFYRSYFPDLTLVELTAR